MLQLLKRAAAIAATGSPLAIGVLTFAFPKWEVAKAISPIQTYLLGYQIEILLALSGLAFAGTIGTLWPVRRTAAIQAYLRSLHARSWGGPSNGSLNPDFRVSFYVPHRFKFWRFGTLACVWRTDGLPPKRARWRMKTKADGDGVVGYVWKTGLEYPVRALSAGASVQEVAAYKKATYITDAVYRKLSWPGAAMLGVPVFGRNPGEKIGVLLVECRVPGSVISYSGKFGEDAVICQLVWERRL